MTTSTPIPLTGAHNTRELGGIQTKDGRKIAQNRCLRSGELYNLTSEDKAVLLKEYRLKTIVDFRTETERTEKPDPDFSGVTSIHLPILEEKTMGITREKDASNGVLASFVKAIQAGGSNADEYMTALYRSIVIDGYSCRQYGLFFDILLQQEHGAVLWHCSAGKDRAGVGTVLFLAALGVPKECIMEDYLLTNTCLKADTDKLMDSLKSLYSEPSVAAACLPLFQVEAQYLDAVFDIMQAASGSVEAFLAEKIGLTREKTERLKTLYLEP